MGRLEAARKGGSWMYREKRWRLLVAVMAALFLVGAACGDDGGDGDTDTGGGNGETEVEQFPADSSLGQIQEDGEITIGVKFDVPPFGFKNPQTGEVEGFDVDMGNYIAEALGVEAKFIEAISDNRIPFLQDGTADLILSTMTITTDRDADIDFSRPYYIAHGSILVPERLRHRVGERPERKARLHRCRHRRTRRRSFPTSPAGEDRVGRHLLRVPRAPAERCRRRGGHRRHHPGRPARAGRLARSSSATTSRPTPTAIGIQEGDKEMKEFVDGVVEDTFADGRWDELYDKWVGSFTGEEADHPEEWTLEEALENYPCVETC